MPVQTYEQLLKERGFRPAGTCNCAGGRTLKYKKDAYMIYMNKGNNIFRIKEGKQVIVTYTTLQKLKDSLNQLYPNVALEEKV
jgi:hypothetical protein